MSRSFVSAIVHRLPAIAFLSVWTLVSPGLAEDEGGKIYQEKCASCHGDRGQGVADGYEKRLTGDYSLEELVELVDSTMPEKNPEECVGDEALQVAAYIYERYYRQSQGASSQLELTRLTVPQYRNAIADVFETFAPREASSEPEPRRRRAGRSDGRPPSPLRVMVSKEHPVPGLVAEYYQSNGMSKADNLVIRRVDSRIDFDFGNGSPGRGITDDQFSIIWEGSLLANETGYYEFRVSTQNGARLYLNFDPQEALRKLRDDSSASGQQALVDAWVGSGELRERSARVFLLGGRLIPLRFEFFKYKESTASVKLEWKPPHGTWSVLDANYTTTAASPRVYVCETPFPADDRSLGYERGTSLSAEWQTATTNAAVAAAAEVVERLPLLAGLTEETADREKHVRTFLLRFAERAFRRPLEKSEQQALLAAAFDSAPSVEMAARRAVVMVLMSPRFLITDLTPASEPPSAFTVATRLALAMWDSIPDQVLLEAAAQGQLVTEEQIEAQARRMLVDPRTKNKVRRFFDSWLEIEDRDLGKDKEKYPEFDEAVVADLRRSLELFINEVVWNSDSDYRELLLADYLFVNDRLREVYNEASPKPNTSSQNGGTAAEEGSYAENRSSAFERVVFADEGRSGVLTHPYLLSAFAYHNNTSPIHRGVFLTRNIVGRSLNPPPMAIAFKDDEFAPELTMREKITQLTRDTACMSCHSVINPLGFTLESFDAVGRWRTSDNNRLVDTNSEYTTQAGDKIELAGARDVALFAVSSQAAHTTFVKQVFQQVVKQDPALFGSGLIDELTAQFAADNFNIRNLWTRVAAKATFSYPDKIAPPQTKLSSNQR